MLDARTNAGFSIHDQNGHDLRGSMDTAAAFRSPQDRHVAGPVAVRPGGSVTALVRPVEHPLGPPRTPGVPGNLHHPRGGGRVRAPRPPLQWRQGFGRPAPPRRQGVQARSDPVPGPSRGHRAQLLRSARLPGRPGRSRGRPPHGRPGAGLHRPGPRRGSRARRRHAIACRPRRCSMPSMPNGFDAAFGGARRDEDKARAKDRVLSFRDSFGQWDPKAQRPELWQLYQGAVRPGEHLRAFPLSDWTELDIWQYIRRERIELPSIYYAHEREVVERDDMLLAAQRVGKVRRVARRSARRRCASVRRRRHLHGCGALGRRHGGGDHPRGFSLEDLGAGSDPGGRSLLGDLHGGSQA